MKYLEVDATLFLVSGGGFDRLWFMARRVNALKTDTYRAKTF
jgi:hypothetical protein